MLLLLLFVAVVVWYSSCLFLLVLGCSCSCCCCCPCCCCCCCCYCCYCCCWKVWLSMLLLLLVTALLALLCIKDASVCKYYYTFLWNYAEVFWQTIQPAAEPNNERADALKLVDGQPIPKTVHGDCGFVLLLLLFLFAILTIIIFGGFHNKHQCFLHCDLITGCIQRVVADAKLHLAGNPKTHELSYKNYGPLTSPDYLWINISNLAGFGPIGVLPDSLLIRHISNKEISYHMGPNLSSIFQLPDHRSQVRGVVDAWQTLQVVGHPLLFHQNKTFKVDVEGKPPPFCITWNFQSFLG